MNRAHTLRPARPTIRARRPGQRRVWALQGLLLAWALAVLTRLFWLQILDRSWLALRAEHQQQRTVALPAQRGAIFDRNLHPLAMSMNVDSVFAVPDEMANPTAEAEQLAPILQLQTRAVATRLTTARSFAWVARQVTAAQADAVRRLHLQGIYFDSEPKRFYPKGDLAANVLGFVGMDGNGLGGIERAFDAEIHGQPGQAMVELDARHQAYSQVERAAQPGADLVLTLDQNIQYMVQQALDQGIAATHAARGVAIVENPHTGEILALANAPTFDPNHLATANPAQLGDFAVSDPYEPGSVFKLVTVSAALQEGLTTPDEVIDCAPGWIRVGGRIIHDHQTFGDLTVTEILQHSSDVGAIKLGLRLGDDRFYKYIQAYGFGRPTGIHLPGESRGLVRPPTRWTPMSIGAISMGQEVAVTPMQVIAMASTLANDGVYEPPRIVLAQVPHTDGAPPAEAPTFEPAPGERIVSAQVALEMKRMMEQVVLAGTAQAARLDGYTAGGKTGTAQKVDPGTRRYSPNHFMASFVGFAPLNDPAIVVLVVLDSPMGDSHEGGATAGPIFKAIAEQVLPYLGVAQDVPPRYGTIAQSSPQRLSPLDAVEESEPVSDQPAVGDDASASAPIPDAGAAAAPAQLTASAPAPATAAAPPPAGAVFDYGTRARVTVPDFEGMSVRAVSEACLRLGLNPILSGDGRAVAQQPAAGVKLATGAAVTVQFRLRN